RVVAEYWASLEDIERFALRHIGNHIHQHDVGVVALGHSLAQRRAYIPGANNGHFAAHVCLSVPFSVATSRSAAPLRRASPGNRLTTLKALTYCVGLHYSQNSCRRPWASAATVCFIVAQNWPTLAQRCMARHTE